MTWTKRTARLLAVGLTAALLLSACSAKTDTSEASGVSEEVSSAAGADSASEGDGQYTLCYVSGDSFNPYTCASSYNEALLSLVYEGLFRVDGGFQPQPVLCLSYTADSAYKQFDLTIRTDAQMHDGSPLTAEDVRYSLELARASDAYASRLQHVTGVEAVSDSVVRVSLSASDSGFPALLDMPIIRSGSGSDSMPAGTGPYALSAAGDALLRFSGYRDSLPACAAKIQLQACASGKRMADAFSDGSVDMLLEDAAGADGVNVHIPCEVRSYDTTVLQYLGFRTGSGLFASRDIRRVVALAVDREPIVRSALSGGASAATAYLPASFWCWDDSWAADAGPDSDALAALLKELGAADINSDGYLEFSSAAQTIRFIAPDSSESVAAAAKLVASQLQAAGLNVEFQLLSWDDYTAALKKGEFDLYFAQVRLTADFDPTLLIGTGGALNYGGYSDAATDAAVTAFLTAGESGYAAAAGSLCRRIAEDAPLVPLAYRQHAVYTRNGGTSGLEPTVSGVFGGIQSVTIAPK